MLIKIRKTVSQLLYSAPAPRPPSDAVIAQDRVIQDRLLVDQKIADLNIAIYQSARTELIQRIVLRDGALLFYIGAVGSYLNFLVIDQFSDAAKPINFAYSLATMVPLPVVCLVFTLIILQHHISIGRLGAFVRFEMDWRFLKENIPPHWDSSRSLLGSARFLMALRLYAQGLILCLPLFYDIFFYFNFRSEAVHAGYLWFGVIHLWNWHFYWNFGWLLIMKVQLFINLTSSAFIWMLHYYAHKARKFDFVNQTPT